MQTWTLQPIASPVILAIVLLILVGLLLVGPSFGELTRSRWLRLVLLRTMVILMAAVAMLRPGCISKTEKNQSAVLPVLIDVTRSMQLPHRGDQSTRWGELVSALKKNRSRIKALRDQQIDVQFFAFDNELRKLEQDNDLPVLPDSPEGVETDIGTPVDDLASSFRGERMLGMLLLSDGMQNALDPNVELLNAVESMADSQVPLYTIPFGLPADVGQLADIAITNLPDQHSIFVKNKLNVSATLVSRGFVNQEIVVQLLISSRESPEEIVVDEQVYTPTRPYEELVVKLNHTPTEPGQFRIKVRAVGQPTEVAVRNNERPSFLTVYDGGLRVLYVEGNLGDEQRFLRQSVPKAAQGIEMDFYAILPHTRRLGWPDQVIGERLKDKAYDVFIIGDLDSSALYKKGSHETNLKALAEQIADGKGLLTLGGYHSFGPGRYHETPLADVLPIRMDPAERQNFGADVRTDLHITRPVKLRPTEPHFLTKLDDSDDPMQAWRRLPPLKGANRFIGVKDNASVLLEGDSKEWILVAGNYGRGRVISFAGDTTWNWWMHDHVDEYKRFWRQIILWLAFRDGRSNDNVWIDLPQRRFQPRSQVSFTCGARDGIGEVITNADYTAILTQPSGSQHQISITKSTERNWAVLERELINEGGLYTIQVAAERNGQPIGESEVEFVVFDQDLEKSNPAANPELMDRLAKQTAEYGGRAVVPEELGVLLDEIAANPPEMKIEVPTKHQLGKSFGDSAIFLGVFVLLLSCEWVLRKKWGLV